MTSERYGRFDHVRAASRLRESIGCLVGPVGDLAVRVMEFHPVSVVELPRLTTSAIADWLRGLSGAMSIGCPIHLHPLNGCLLARGGAGLIFVCAELDEGDRRFTIAHEVAHYFLHYLEPRRHAVELLGPDILEVLDGRRSPTQAERTNGALSGVPLATFTDMIARGARHRPAKAVIEKEDEADILALELLAPHREVADLKTDGSVSPGRLADTFRIPVWAAASWLEFLGTDREFDDPIVTFLRGGRKKS